MGIAYRKNLKNQYGRPDIIGREVVELGASSVQAPVGATALTDRLGASRWAAGANARLEGAHVSLGSGDLTLGRVGVEVLLDSTVVATGNLYAGGPDGAKYITLSKEKQEEVAVASGAVLTANYSVEQSLDTVQTLRVSLSLALLEHAE